MENVIQIFRMSDQDGAMAGASDVKEKIYYGPSLSVHRTSQYTIYVDLPDSDEAMLLVHGYLGHRVLVSKKVAAYLRKLELKRPPRPLYGEWQDDFEFQGEPEKPSEETFQQLVQYGFLTKRTSDEELAFFKRFVEVKRHKSSMKMPQYLFMPTYDCNLRCPYCFQDHMRKDPAFKKFLKLMDKETVDRIFLAMPKIEEKHGFEQHDELRHRHISFFGGEPLLKENKEIIRYIMERAKDIGSASFSATSNGTELEFYQDLLGKDGISEIQITLDGKAEEHDKRRIYPDGSGSFGKIANNIDISLLKGVSINVRINVDYGNINDLPELASYIYSRGWPSKSNFFAYLAPIHAANENTDKSQCMTTLKLNKEMIKMRALFPNTAIFSIDYDKMKSSADSILKNPDKSESAIKTNYCAAHDRMYLFDAQADIYACWEKTGDKNIRIGAIDKYAGLRFFKDQEDNWRTRSVVSNSVCIKCRYAMHCGGGCAVYASEKSGSLHSNFCDDYGKRFRTSVAESYINLNKDTLMRV